MLFFFIQKHLNISILLLFQLWISIFQPTCNFRSPWLVARGINKTCTISLLGEVTILVKVKKKKGSGNFRQRSLSFMAWDWVFLLLIKRGHRFDPRFVHLHSIKNGQIWNLLKCCILSHTRLTPSTKMSTVIKRARKQ